MLMTVDLGNTNIFLGIFDDDNLIDTFRLSSKTYRTADEYGLLLIDILGTIDLKTKDIDNIVISSVVPPIASILKETFNKYFQSSVLNIGPGIKTGINIRTDNPKEVGADRLVNVAAAHEIYQQSCIIIDFGTATTFDYVSSDGIFQYTIIMPGMKLAAEALFHGTAKLPDVEIKKPETILASNTIHGMQAGIVYGYIGAIKYTLKKQCEALNDKPYIIATGGIATEFIDELPEIDEFVPDLAMQGMRIIFNKNKK